MRLAKFYYSLAIAVGILEIIDGVLLLLNKGLLNWFNGFVSDIELNWLPFCAFTAVIFYKKKIGLLSPLVYMLYQFMGWIVAAMLLPSGTETISVVPVWASALGAGFGLCYLLINEIMIRRIPEQENEDSL